MSKQLYYVTYCYPLRFTTHPSTNSAVQNPTFGPNRTILLHPRAQWRVPDAPSFPSSAAVPCHVTMRPRRNFRWLHRLRHTAGLPAGVALAAIEVATFRMASVAVGMSVADVPVAVAALAVGAMHVAALSVAAIAVGSLPVAAVTVTALAVTTLPIGALSVATIAIGTMHVAAMPVAAAAVASMACRKTSAADDVNAQVSRLLEEKCDIKLSNYYLVE